MLAWLQAAMSAGKFNAFQCSVNLEIFDQGPWHFNICDVKDTISCRVCRRFDERLGHLQLC